MTRRALAFALATAVAACGDRAERAVELARAGRVDEAAPIKASCSIVIAAPATRIWKLLTQIDDWPTWQPEISAAHLAGPLRAGTSFTWTNGGTVITSQITLVEPAARVAWVGTAMGLTAVHVWRIRELGDGRTLVRTDESMTGFPSSMFYSSHELGAANTRWLAKLKAAAESGVRGQ